MEVDSGSEDWTVSGHRMWALVTADGDGGEAHWREQGAGSAVVRPDGKKERMNTADARILARNWQDAGSKPCDHPIVEKESGLRRDTGDWICTACGAAGWGPDWAKARMKSKSPRAG